MGVHIQQLLNEAEYDKKNYAVQGGCYPPRPQLTSTSAQF